MIFLSDPNANPSSNNEDKAKKPKTGFYDSSWIFKRRFRRRLYIPWTVTIFIIVVYFLPELRPPYSANNYDPNNGLLDTLLNLFFLGVGVMFSIKRAHDISHPAWIPVIIFILSPIAISFILFFNATNIDLTLALSFAPSFIYYLILIFKDSTPGPNKYGENPKGIQVIEGITYQETKTAANQTIAPTITDSGYQDGYSGGHNSPLGRSETDYTTNKNGYKDGDLYN